MKNWSRTTIRKAILTFGGDRGAELGFLTNKKFLDISHFLGDCSAIAAAQLHNARNGLGRKTGDFTGKGLSTDTRLQVLYHYGIEDQTRLGTYIHFYVKNSSGLIEMGALLLDMFLGDTMAAMEAERKEHDNRLAELIAEMLKAERGVR